MARLEAREAELDSAIAQVAQLVGRKDSHVRIEEDRLVLSPLEAEERPASATALADRIAERLPRVALPELLIEVDAWTHFSPHCVHAALAHLPHPGWAHHPRPC